MSKPRYKLTITTEPDGHYATAVRDNSESISGQEYSTRKCSNPIMAAKELMDACASMGWDIRCSDSRLGKVRYDNAITQTRDGWFGYCKQYFGDTHVDGNEILTDLSSSKLHAMSCLLELCKELGWQPHIAEDIIKRTA